MTPEKLTQDICKIVTAIKDRVDIRLNKALVEMEPGFDDSITGFNDAWDIVRRTFADSLADINETEPSK